MNDRPFDQLELFNESDENADFGEWMESLPPTPESSLDETLGRGAAYWARWRRLRESQGWMAP
jgi:hypothetical protein